jgi:imidazolonepropionase-like amidohydrolase
MSDNTLLISNATVIDGTGKSPFNASILIKNKRIEKITNGIINEKVDKIFDATGKYVLPGMIDCHVHFMINDYNITEHINTPFSLNFYHAIENANSMLRAGITTARDAGGADLGFKRAVEKGLFPAPDVQISVSIMSITGGHLDAWLPSGMQTYILSPPHPGKPCGICDGTQEVRKKTREILRAGADIIKVCSTGGVLSPTDHPEFSQFSIEELKVIVEEAHMRKGRKVMAHAQGLKGIKNAIRSGVHSIEHGFFLDDEAVDLMVQNNVFLVPTLLAVYAIIEGDYPDNVKDKAKEIFEIHQKSIEKAFKAGVKIAMGTDSGVMRHGRNLEELKLMCDVGMSPMDAIKASTQIAAECLEIENKVGTLKSGKQADMIIVNKNPLKDISILSDKKNFKQIIQKGKLL